MDNSFESIIEFESIEQAIALFGQYDENTKAIEDGLNVKLISRDTEIKITGSKENIDKASLVIERLIDIISQGESITKQSVNYLVNLAAEGQADRIKEYPGDCICLTAKGRQIKSKTYGQMKYINAIRNNTIVFSIGPAGTGKTYLAVAMAVTAFKDKQVNRIILTRPAVEAGEKLGFLPGDMQNKVDPYLRPLYDALFEIMGAESYQKYLEKGMIEIAPLAYMRGRTLDDSFIILDEAQNTTPEQMKMFLTRIGFGSKAVVTGDITQIDLPGDKKSGLKEVTKILEHVEDLEFVYLTDKDVVRHELVQRIIKAYEKYDLKNKTGNK